MPPRINSRHEFVTSFDDVSTDVRVLSARVPFRFREFDDNIKWVVGEGDTLFTISNKVYQGFGDRPAGLWWIVADFQPDPILDPTLVLDVGRTIFAPSERRSGRFAGDPEGCRMRSRSSRRLNCPYPPPGWPAG